jgi:tetratricopeptide (TPR) repeat protein
LRHRSIEPTAPAAGFTCQNHCVTLPSASPVPLKKLRNECQWALVCLAVIGIAMLLTRHAEAQEDSTHTETDSAQVEKVKLVEQAELDKEAQKELVNAIYNATKTAKTEVDYSDFLDQCHAALAKQLSAKNREYINSLIGWALNRRGEKRFELAVQLKSIENRQHVQVMERAMKDFDEAVIADPNRYRSWMSRGIAQVENGKYDLAIADFTKVIKLKPDEANGWFNRAEALYQRSDPANFSQATTSADRSTNTPDAASTDEDLKQQRQGYQQAVSDYDVVLRLNSNDTQALTGRGHAKFALGEYEAALADYEQVIKLVPENATAFVNRGDIHQRLGNWEPARADFETALSIEKTGVACQRAAWFKATCPDQSFRDASQALSLIQQAIELDGDTATNLDTLAAAEAAAGNFDVAKSTQQKVIGLVNVEVSPDAKQYQARLALYEKGEPYTQVVEEETEQANSTETDK